MMLNFNQLICFTLVLLGFGLALVAPFLVYLFYRDRREREAAKQLGDSCHSFQRETASRTGEAFNAVVSALNKNSEALIRNSEALRDAERVRGSART